MNDSGMSRLVSGYSHGQGHSYAKDLVQQYHLSDTRLLHLSCER